MLFRSLFACASLLAVPALAQQTLTDRLRQNEAGHGVVTIQQSAEIEQVVNHGNQKPVAPVTPAEPKPTEQNSEKPHESHTTKTKPSSRTYTSSGRHKARGYRICIFTGGNSRADKTKAAQMGQKCRQRFPELSVYSMFQPPRWVTHVGDFRSKEDAQKYVTRIRRAGFTYEARIVGSEVNLRNQY